MSRVPASMLGVHASRANASSMTEASSSRSAACTRRDAALTRTALQHALSRRWPEPGLPVHADRGIEYGAYDYQAALRRRGIVQSMNRPGQMNDNAHMESFFHSLKSEFLWGKQFDSDDELRQTLPTYLQFYNTHGFIRHSITRLEQPSRIV